MKRSKRTTRKSQVAIKKLIKWLNYAKLLQECKTTTKECKRTTKARGEKLQRKVTEKLKTIKKRPNNCKESDTTKNAAKANNEKKVDEITKWYKTNTKKKQL